MPRANGGDRQTEGEVVTSKIGGVLGSNVMDWFKKRNGDTLRGALAFVPWVIHHLAHHPHMCTCTYSYIKLRGGLL